MKMKCSKCGREMDLWEFATYAEAYLLKLVVKSSVVAFLVETIKHYFLTQTRGFVDSQMAGLANNFNINCPTCKVAGSWEPAPDKDTITKSESETLTL
jgi:hypothetical protein